MPNTGDIQYCSAVKLVLWWIFTIHLLSLATFLLSRHFYMISISGLFLTIYNHCISTLKKKAPTHWPPLHHQYRSPGQSQQYKKPGQSRQFRSSLFGCDEGARETGVMNDLLRSDKEDFQKISWEELLRCVQPHIQYRITITITDSSAASGLDSGTWAGSWLSSVACSGVESRADF